MDATVIFHINQVKMISRTVIQRTLQTSAPVIFLLLFSSISALAQSPSKSQELTRILFKNSTVKIAISFVGKQIGPQGRVRRYSHG